MDGIHLFSLASQKSRWLSVRQAAIAENVANVDTPRFKTRDVQPFADVLDRTRLTLSATNAAHLGSAREVKAVKAERAESWGVTHSGNSVSVEQELMKAGEVNRDHALTTGVVKSFHRMILSTLKG